MITKYLTNLIPNRDFKQLNHKDTWTTEIKFVCVYVYFSNAKLEEPPGMFFSPLTSKFCFQKQENSMPNMVAFATVK